MFNPLKPYNELPLLPPEIELSPAIYLKAIKANRSLAELKGLARQIPNQGIILNTLVLREAKDSSEIENIVTTQDELYRAISIESDNIDPQVKEVLMYREALWHGYGLISKKRLITSREICKIQEYLLGNNAGFRKQPGTVLKNARNGRVIYTPPTGKSVIEEKIKNLEIFINEETAGYDPLIKMAVMHYQFEAIHPFYDGNGRTGRMLNVLYLINEGLLDLPILYLSSYIIRNKQKYYSLLNEVRTKGNWEEWIMYMLDSVDDSAVDTIRMIGSIRNLLEQQVELVRKKRPKIYSRELVEGLFLQPYTRISALENLLDISRFTASKYLRELEEIGVLKAEKAGRDMLYLNVKLFNLLHK